MDPYYELAYALESQSLSFFVGTGFSMHLTDGAAPSWLSLLKTCCEKIDGGEELAEQLFPNNNPIMSLEECASIIKVKMDSQGHCLHTEISKVIGNLELGESGEETKEVLEGLPAVTFITTNYDLLIEEELIGDDKCTSYSIGYPINRQAKDYQVYHVHGSVKYPKKMIVTADDYFRFINYPDYFAKKVQTLIEESTTVIIGYSLGDVNFKAILNNIRSNRIHDINRQNLFFLSRNPVDKNIKDYYDRSYGLRVIESTDVEGFLRKIDAKHEQIKERVSRSRDLLMPVLEGKKRFTDSYLKKRDSFYEIIATLSSNGIIVSHSKVVKFLKDIFERKRGFTRVTGAWQQYKHLAGWLVHIGAIMDIKGTPLEEAYLKAVEASFDNMSKRKIMGKSWDSFVIWKRHWLDLTYDNRIMICQYFEDKDVSSDASEVMSQ